jgi:methyl-accepting chemotaxis protein
MEDAMSPPPLRILLSHKIAAIGAVGVLGLAVVGAIYLIGASVQERYRLAAADAQATLTLTSGLDVKLLESRQTEKDFLLRNEMKYVDRHKTLDAAIDSGIEMLRRQADSVGLDDLARKIELVRVGYRSYAAHFAAVAETRLRLGLNENSGLEGALRGSVHAIETRLNQLKEARLLVTMLMMRRHEKDFMLRRDAKYGEEMKKRAAEFAVALDATDIPPAVKNDIKRDLAAYQRDFFAWMTPRWHLRASRRPRRTRMARSSR